MITDKTKRLRKNTRSEYLKLKMLDRNFEFHDEIPFTAKHGTNLYMELFYTRAKTCRELAKNKNE